MGNLLVRCECGERFEADEAAAKTGTVKCPKCGRKLKIKRIREGRRARPVKVSAASRFFDKAGAAVASASAKAARNASQRPVITPFARLVTILCWAYVALAALLVIVAWGLGDEWWPGTILLFVGRWVFLLPLIGLIPAALFARAWLLLPLTLATTLIVGPLMGARVGLEGMMPAPEGTKIRVLTFNTGAGAGAGVDLEFLLEAWNADIVAFQECTHSVQDAIARLGKPWSHHEERGLCMITRFPIRAVSIMDRKTLEEINEKGGGIGGSGDVIRYDLETPAGLVHFTNVHLETPRKGFEAFFTRAGGAFELLKQNTKLRDAESRLARRHVDAGGIPLIVAGDFNTTIESRIFQRHWGDFKDAFTAAGFGFGMTKYNGWIRVRIDHVLTDDSFGITHVELAEDRGSDHRPVIADLVLKRRKNR